jgi:uncharacterized protein YxeA
MKKIIVSLIVLVALIGCRKTDFIPPVVDVPNPLQITNKVGVKLESPFVTSEVAMNVKLETSGNYTIKIMDISNRVVSKETLYANSGDNILKVYTNALPPSAYRIGIYDKDGNMLGITDFNKL